MKQFGNGDIVYNMTISVQEELNMDNVAIDKEDSNFKFYWDSELDQIKNVSTDWIIDDWIPKGDICFVAGKAASYKTTVCTHMAYALATGSLVFNKYKTIKSRILYLNEENNPNIMMNVIDRVKAGLSIEDKNDELAFSMMEGIRLDKVVDLNQIIDFIIENNIEVLICDSFRRFIGFDENNATEMNMLFNNLKKLRKICNNLTIIILHHQKKNDGNGGDIRDSLRGSSDIVNSADSIITMGRKAGTKYIKIGHIKNRSGEEMIDKILIIDSGDDKKMAYIYESDKSINSAGVYDAQDKCAERIIKWTEDSKVDNFKKKDVMNEMSEEFSESIIRRALATMCQDGSLDRVGSTRSSTYCVIKLVSKEEKEDESQKKL